MLKVYSFLINLIITGVNFLMVLFMQFLYLSFYFSRRYKSNGNIHILANGPSLENDKERIRSSIVGDSIMCVNLFAVSDLYEELKPDYYIVVDPDFFNIYHVDSPNKEAVHKTTESILNNTFWDMVFFVPYKYRNSNFVKELVKSKFIKVSYVKNIPVADGFINVNAWLYSLGIANPLFQNVLIAGIDTAIKSRFETIYIWGADHSWLKNISFQNDNKSLINDSHFYKSSNPVERKWKRFDLSLLNFQRCFRAYYELEIVARKRNVKIFNCSSESWINAFERKLD